MFAVSVLETERSLVLAEKGSGDNDDVELIGAAAGFRLVATMNPGGDFGKKEVDWKKSVSTDWLLSVKLRMKVAVLYLPVVNSTEFESRMFVQMI